MAAATLPGSSDVGRIDIEHKQAAPEGTPGPEALPEIVLPSTEIPPGADHVKLTLESVDIEGATAFSHEEIEGLDGFEAFPAQDSTE